MKALAGKTYCQIVASRAYWIFTQVDLPEWNEAAFTAVDVTGAVPNIGDVWNGSAFAAYVPTPQEVAAAALLASDTAARTVARANPVIQYLVSHTPAECSAYVATNVTNLATAVTFLQHVAVALCVLSRTELR